MCTDIMRRRYRIFSAPLRLCVEIKKKKGGSTQDPLFRSYVTYASALTAAMIALM